MNAACSVCRTLPHIYVFRADLKLDNQLLDSSLGKTVSPNLSILCLLVVLCLGWGPLSFPSCISMSLGFVPSLFLIFRQPCCEPSWMYSRCLSHSRLPVPLTLTVFLLFFPQWLRCLRLQSCSTRVCVGSSVWFWLVVVVVVMVWLTWWGARATYVGGDKNKYLWYGSDLGCFCKVVVVGPFKVPDYCPRCDPLLMGGPSVR